jgi:uracil-DNA glycosylase
MNNNDFHICRKCFELTGMHFQRTYSPIDYLLGKRNSKIWIIGLNPYGNIGENNTTETIENLSHFIGDISYFKDFNNVSNRIYNLLGQENGVAHTDLVKCFSKNFPPSNLKRNELHYLICNCRNYLKDQIDLHKPKLIICNGIHVVWHVEQLIPPIKTEDFESYYYGNLPHKPIVFRSGFIGRIDNYSKRRLGKEIENIIDENNIICA